MPKEKTIYRSKEKKLLAGVCSGFAKYFNTDPSLMRLFFIVLAMFYGTGVMLYLILWVILPEK